LGKRKNRNKIGLMGHYSPRYWGSWLIVGLSWLLAKIPMPVQHKIAEVLARLALKSSSGRIKSVRRNIELCFPDLSAHERENLLRKNMFSTVLLIFDMLAMIWASSSSVLERGRIVGGQHFRDALQADKPLILVSGHATTFLIGLAKLTEISAYSAVYRRMDNPVLEEKLYQGATKNFPIETIHRKQIPLMLDKLSNKGTVAILPDQDFGPKRSAFIPFFGIDTATITAIPQYAAASDANVQFVYSYREPNGRFVVEVSPVLENYPSGDDVADTRLWSDWLEGEIRKHPEDYFWLHKRFKTRPEGQAELY
jgi:Kdo2-lipid IVA lauroyltransferase/acyltransferase